MTHVTVVRVHEARLQNCGDETALGRGEAILWDVSDERPCLAKHLEDAPPTPSEEPECFEPQQYDIQTPEVVYVNLKELNLAHGIMQRDSSAIRVPEDRDLPEIHTPKRSSRKSGIIDQNVGVTGTVFMMSDPKCQLFDSSDDDDDSVSSLSDSLSSLSESDSGLSSTIEVGMSPPPRHSTTITIGDESCSDATQQQVAPVSATSGSEESRQQDDQSVASAGQAVALEAKDSEVTLEWRVIPPDCPEMIPNEAAHELEGDRGSTPTSFSSAYTVTEHESESASDDSASSRHNWSGQESDEESQRHEAVRGPQALRTSSLDAGEEETLGWPESARPRATESSLDKSDSGNECTSETAQTTVKKGSVDFVRDAVMLTAPCMIRSPDLRQMLRRLRHVSGGSNSSGEESIVFSYIPCRDQREKDDEELWVANEAADPMGSQAFQGVTPPLLPPPMGWGGSVGRGASRPAGLPRQGLVWAEQPRGSDGCVTGPSCVSSIMCTLAPSPTDASLVGGPPGPRRHYSTRQRVTEPQIINVKVIDEEPKYNQNRTSASETNIKTEVKNGVENCHLPTSITTNQPTKRFSFLIRSNSVKQDLVEEKNAANLLLARPARDDDPVTPSDQAILEKLATLNLEARNVGQKPRARASCFDPPCAKCGEPVYPQERTEPTLRLVFHSSCFKCFHCGLRLTLKTFYRSPLDSKDTRLFCKSHVPQLDPGKLDAGRADSSSSSTSSYSSSSSSSSGKSSPDSSMKDGSCNTSSRSSICSSNKDTTVCTVQDRLDVVKCDTIGLRYF
ncbi:uncharacterized protein LOC122263850 [Penaeus japonicus]|uniref:uncharacterized protein LOC122263850 n=1 Tax=Penaeus japonicus TaxID=27405 RepID=UPI001C70D772|nr:uncharacterized protein LOC122263850 [Penaeus japonicus]